MKIHIFYNFQDGPWGGGNQFLKALREHFLIKGVYTECLEEADIILVNSHHLGNLDNLCHLIRVLLSFPTKTVIHRIDGPVGKIRGDDHTSDHLIFLLNNVFASGSIIQSRWCRDNCVRLGLNLHNQPNEIIFNAPDPNIFYPDLGTVSLNRTKIRLIATSWSPNMGKGYDTYKWIDQNLDWYKYAMTFVGNSPINFENIKLLSPMDSKTLGKCLREQDIFITASRSDPCSNSLIEALHTRLPALVYNDGGHPEIIKNGGLTFDSPDAIPEKLTLLSTNLDEYRSKINLPSMGEIAEKYIRFMKDCAESNTKHINKKAAYSFKISYENYLKEKRPSSLPIRVLKKLSKILD